MKTYTAVIERDAETGLYVGYIPGWPGAHSQGETLDELSRNLEEVTAMLLEDGEPSIEGESLGAPLLTLDRRLAGVTGTRCCFRIPEG